MEQNSDRQSSSSGDMTVVQRGKIQKLFFFGNLTPPKKKLKTICFKDNEKQFQWLYKYYNVFIQCHISYIRIVCLPSLVCYC